MATVCPSPANPSSVGCKTHDSNYWQYSVPCTVLRQKSTSMYTNTQYPMLQVESSTSTSMTYQLYKLCDYWRSRNFGYLYQGLEKKYYRYRYTVTGGFIPEPIPQFQNCGIPIPLCRRYTRIPTAWSSVKKPSTAF